MENTSTSSAKQQKYVNVNTQEIKNKEKNLHKHDSVSLTRLTHQEHNQWGVEHNELYRTSLVHGIHVPLEPHCELVKVVENPFSLHHGG